MFARLFVFFWVLVSASWAFSAIAQEVPEPIKKTGEAGTLFAEKSAEQDASIAELIQKLDANSFPERQQASQQLSTLGKAAIPALAEAAMNGNRETVTRAIDVLKGHLKNSDDATKAAAKEALEKIKSEGNGPGVRQADLALNPQKGEKQNAPNGLGGVQLNGMPIGGGQIQIQMQIQGGNGGLNTKKITMKNVNGVKTIEAVENGRKVKINEDPNNGIQIEVTETKDGKETIQKYEAKDTDELKKKHPEGHKLYEQYHQPGAAGRIQIGGGPGILPGVVPGVPLPLAPNAIPAVPLNLDANRRMQAHRLESISRQLEMVERQLKRVADENPTSEHLQKSMETLKKSQEELREAKAKLDVPEKDVQEK